MYRKLSFLCVLSASSLVAANNYLVHYLVSDLPNTADHVDPNLVNPWGLGFSDTGPFWIGDNLTGISTIYDTSGTPAPLVVHVPMPGGPDMKGRTTGVLYNTSQSFLVGGQAATFIFCTEDGTISGWNSSVDPTHALIMIDDSASHAVYKGCALGNSTAGPTLYVANFSGGTVDVYDGSLNEVTSPGAFIDPMIPSGFAPFNVAVLLNRVYVAYAKQNASKTFDVAGAGNGYIDAFDMNGVLISSFLAQGALNSPWGMAVAPATFGDFAGMILIGNFGDGRINVYQPNTNTLIGPLSDVSGQPITIPGLWALAFGNGHRAGDANTLYFTAGIPGPDGGIASHGVFGSVEPAPLLQTTGVVNSASLLAQIAPNTWTSIFGGALAASTRDWQPSDFANGSLPASLNGVSAAINGEPAYLSYISPGQVNLLLPADIPPGPATLRFKNNGLVSGMITINVQPQAPAFFLNTGGKYVVATHIDFSPAGPANLIKGAITTPVKPNEVISLWATGFGATNPSTPNGHTISAPLSLASVPTILIGGESAQVLFAGLTAAGLYQINVVVPSDMAAGDAPVVAIVNGSTSPVGMLSIAQVPQNTDTGQ